MNLNGSRCPISKIPAMVICSAAIRRFLEVRYFYITNQNTRNIPFLAYRLIARPEISANPNFGDFGEISGSVFRVIESAYISYYFHCADTSFIEYRL